MYTSFSFRGYLRPILLIGVFILVVGVLSIGAEEPVQADQTSRPIDELLCTELVLSDPSLLRQLLDKEANPNHYRYYGGRDTPLMYAAEGGYYDAIEILLEYGAEIDALNKEGNTALLLAVRADHAHCLNLLLTKGAKLYPPGTDRNILVTAIEKGNEKTTALLLSNGADIHATDRGTTPLALAIMKRNMGLVQQLIDRGVKEDLGPSYSYSSLLNFSFDIDRFLTFKLIEQGVSLNADSYGVNLLCKAASRVDLEMVRLLIERGVDVNAVCDDGTTALSSAAFAMYKNPLGIKEVVKYLLDHGADPNRIDNLGATALSHWVIANNIDCLSLLLDSGAEVTTSDDMTLLHYAVLGEASCMPTVQLLIDRGVDPNVRDREGMTALERAAVFGNREIFDFLLPLTDVLYRIPVHSEEQVDFLRPIDKLLHTPLVLSDPVLLKKFLDMGVDPNQRDRFLHYTLLMLAVNECYESAKVLIEYGAEIDTLNNDGETALALAVQGNRVHCLYLLLEQGAKLYPPETDRNILVTAINSGNDATIALLMSRGADLNVADKGITPLAAAIANNKLRLARKLLDQGASIHSVDSKLSPLYFALKAGDCSLIADLLERGARLDIVAGEVVALLPTVVFSGNFEIVRLLVERGMELNIAGGKEDLLLAASQAREPNIQLLRYLLDHGADPNLAGQTGMTPLMGLAHVHNLSCLTLILDSGAEVNRSDDMGWTALHYAVDYAEGDDASNGSSLSIVQHLIARGANINARTQDGRTPLQLAADKNNRELFHYLLPLTAL